jgi:hypothetical protein
VSRFERTIRRRHLMGAVIATARAHGCTCDPDVTLPPGGVQRGTVRVVTVAHDDDCPHRRDPDTPAWRSIKAQINGGEWDLERG